MELSFCDLRQREVINVADGMSLGKIINLYISFPSGKLAGIAVPGRKTKGLICWLSFLDKTEIYIDQSKILKIGNDVILVNLKCGDVCSPNINMNPPKQSCNPCAPNNPQHFNSNDDDFL